jgi:hypothetical protein
MRKLIPFLLRSIWALSLIVISGTYAFGQDVYQIRQDALSANHVNSLYFNMVDATDGYTAETGLTPTCTILYPSKTSYVSCPDTVTEIGTGTYRVRLSNGAEWEDLGKGSLYITGTGARPARLFYDVVEDGIRWRDGASLNKSPSNLSNTQQWNTGGITVTSNSTADYIGYTIGDTITGDGASSSHRAWISVNSSRGGSREYYGTAEVKSGSLNNIWVGDENWGVGIDLNTSSGAVSVSNVAYLRGWKIEKLASSWWRIHWRYFTSVQDATAFRLTVALGNGTVGTAPPVFTTSGTMIVARAYIMPIEAVSAELLNDVLPALQTASSTTSVTLALAETTGNDVIKNREICFNLGYTATAYQKVNTHCTCITAYNGTTKVATLSPATSVTLNSEYKYKIGGSCLTNVNVSSMSADVVTASAIATDAIGASEIASSAIGASELATDAIGADEIGTSAITSSEFAQSSADKVWNTVPQDGSATTALGYLDAIKKYVANKMSVVGSNYTIYKDDQTTSYATGTTNSAGRDPD